MDIKAITCYNVSLIFGEMVIMTMNYKLYFCLK